MIPAMLVSAVVHEVQTAAAGYKMRAEGQADKTITVYPMILRTIHIIRSSS